MNFSSMEYFTILARERSFTKAAEQLHITQQSLSSHIAGLEKELGCQLLVRHIPLELTYAGEVFLRYAGSFQDTQTAMLREFGDISQNQKGILRVGAAPTRGRVLLPQAIASLVQTIPSAGSCSRENWILLSRTFRRLCRKSNCSSFIGRKLS